jgi:pyruvate/oxaloacetate carboxyltransferase
LTQIINEFKVIYKISDKNNFKFELQTFIPDKTKNQIYSFMNFEYVYKFEKYNLETYIKGQNLLNVKKYEDHLVSDYAYSSFSYNLQERFVLFGIIYKIL